MKEAISFPGTMDPTPAVSSAGGSSHTVNVSRPEPSSYVPRHEEVSLSNPQHPMSLKASAGGFIPCRPWDRGDLLRRLSTFSPSNWSSKPKIVSSLSCAQRGWVNIDIDKISCETCGAFLSFTSIPDCAIDEDGAIENFAAQLDFGHNVPCPWRGNSCPESLVQFPPTPQYALVGGYRDRCDGLLQFQCLPVVTSSAIEQMSLSHGPQLEHFLSAPSNFNFADRDFKMQGSHDFNSQDSGACLYTHAQKIISLCGWEPIWIPNVRDIEEHSAQSARNGCSLSHTQTQAHVMQNPGRSSNGAYASGRTGTGKKKVIGLESTYESRAPVLDCSLCGAVVRILDFLTVPFPARFQSTNHDIPETSKKTPMAHGVSAASGINGLVADIESEQIEDRDEVTTTNNGSCFPNANVDLNLAMSSSYAGQLRKTKPPLNIQDSNIGRDLVIGQPCGSEVGDRATSYESHGPSSHKRYLEKAGSSDGRSHLRMQQADGMEGSIIDHDNEVTNEMQYFSGRSKRIRDSSMFDVFNLPIYQRESSRAGPSHLKHLEVYGDPNRLSFARRNSDQNLGTLSTRGTAQASSVIAMDTICHSADDDSAESVENCPEDIADVHFPSSSMYGNLEVNDTSELDCSNQAQQSVCIQPSGEAPRAAFGVSSTDEGEELFNVEATAHPRERISFGISGGSVGMCASHEAEIHGADVSVHKVDSVVGDADPRVDDMENQAQTAESVPDPGLMDEVAPPLLVTVLVHNQSQDMSQSVEKADSGSKVDGSVKAESVESGEKMSKNHKEHPSSSCNAILCSGSATSRGINGGGKASPARDSTFLDSDFVAVNGVGKHEGKINYDKSIEFDPITNHNQFCPWVNGNVASAVSNSAGSGTSSGTILLCGWQLTLDALDALRSLGHLPNQTAESESAASLHKGDNQARGKKVLQYPSTSRSCGRQ